MAGRLTHLAVEGVSKRIPGLRRLPAARIILAAEVLVLAREHFEKLEPRERRRIVQLLRTAHGRPRNLTAAQHDELAGLVAKAEPRLLAGLAAEKLSPVPLPKRVIYGPQRRTRR